LTEPGGELLISPFFGRERARFLLKTVLDLSITGDPYRERST
jgi:hypothetical protein